MCQLNRPRVVNLLLFWWPRHFDIRVGLFFFVFFTFYDFRLWQWYSCLLKSVLDLLNVLRFFYLNHGNNSVIIHLWSFRIFAVTELVHNFSSHTRLFAMFLIGFFFSFVFFSLIMVSFACINFCLHLILKVLMKRYQITHLPIALLISNLVPWKTASKNGELSKTNGC